METTSNFLAYKYCPPERIDILENKRIRFTQLCDLNDPTDGLPTIHLPEDPKEFILKTIENNRDNPSIIEIKRLGLLEKAIETESRRYQTDPTVLQKYCYNVYRNFNDMFAVLSLSKNANSELMWSYYCNNSSGFVIEIVLSDSSLSRDSKLHSIGENDPRDVIYSTTRHAVSIDRFEIPLDAIFTKSEAWSHEEEVRIIRRIDKEGIKNYSDVNIIKRDSRGGINRNVYLFNLPPSSIRGVVIGYNCTDDIRDSIVKLIRNDPELQHLYIKKSVLKTSGYGFEYLPI